MIREFYKDKTILLTGCTGFVGKVVLEKLMRCCPDIKRIYVLVRPKRGTAPMDRVWKDIFASECFDLLRSQTDLIDLVKHKIVPIEGDLR